MKPLKAIIIVGLPCSGKSTLLKTFDGYKIDDIANKNQLPKKLDQNLIITSPHFIFKEQREAVINDIKKLYGDKITIELLFFENDFKKCLNNLNKRGDQKTKPVKSFILNLHQYYHIPDNAKVIQINN